jgi:hypothetical protein
VPALTGLDLGAFHRQPGLDCRGGPPLWQNTIEYKWLGAGDVLDGRMVLEVVPIDRRFWPRGLWARRLQKEGRCSDERKHVAQR